jgi:hypothetical protein
MLEARFRQFVLGNMPVDSVCDLSEDRSSLISIFQSEILRGVPDAELESGRRANPELEASERRIFYELVWVYVQAGILRLTVKEPSRPWSGVYLTADGRKTLEGGTPIPEDVEAYLARLKTDAPELDDTARFYVREALLAFRSQLYPSAAVMLGCGAEYLVIQIAERLVPKLHADKQRKLKAALGRPISILWLALSESLEPYRKSIFTNERVASQVAFDGLFFAVKGARDEAGHPQQVHIGEGEARALLQAFLQHAKAASLVLAWERM